jgi:hypothetical protein
MRKQLLIVFLTFFWVACNIKEKEYTIDDFVRVFNVDLMPMGTYFWDEFSVMEVRYDLTGNESKLIGRWYNADFLTGLAYNSYTFFPNKLFILKFYFQNYQVIDTEETYFNKALGTWELVDGVVRIMIYTIITVDYTLDYPNNKGVFFVESPYSIDFIKIEDIDERGFTKRPINDAILSKELRQKVTIRERNKTNDLYVRNVYTIDVITDSGNLEKNYGYFSIVPELAQKNISGLDVVTNPELIRKHIPDWWY